MLHELLDECTVWLLQHYVIFTVILDWFILFRFFILLVLIDSFNMLFVVYSSGGYWGPLHVYLKFIDKSAVYVIIVVIYFIVVWIDS